MAVVVEAGIEVRQPQDVGASSRAAAASTLFWAKAITSGRAFDRHNAVARLIGRGWSVAVGAAGGIAAACGFSLRTGAPRNCGGPGSGAEIASGGGSRTAWGSG